MNKQNITKLETGQRTTGIYQLYKDLPEHIIPLQKSQPPYMKVTNGYFGFQGIVLLDQVLDRIQCHICGRWFKCLSAHLKIHDIDHITYKDRFGLYRSEPLARLKTLQRWSKMNKEREQVKNLESNRPTRITEDEVRKISNDARKKDQWKNKYGTCKAQLRFRLEEAIKKFGGLPPSDSREYKNLYRLFVNRFGGFREGLEYYKILSPLQTKE